MDRKLEGLQVLRALAAALVLLQHAVVYAPRPADLDLTEFLRLNAGGIGVYIFFVISGFVMALVGRGCPLEFVTQRAFRIYPPFFLSVIVAYTVIYLFKAPPAPLVGLDTLLLLPIGNIVRQLHLPYWTLIYEVVFYAVVALMLALRLPSGARIALMVAWAIYINLGAHFVLSPSFDYTAPSWSTVLASSLNLHFIIGYALGVSYFESSLRPISIVVAGAAGSAVLINPSASVMLTYSIASCALIYLAVMSPASRMKSLVARAGDWSYGLYLFHLPAQLAVHMMLLGSGVPFPVAIAANLVIGGAVGLAFGYLEHLMHERWFKPLAKTLSGRGVSAAAQATPAQTAEHY
jgi:exopolysaccharide production protein ExoZ